MRESWEELYADRAARTRWPAESSDEYREGLGSTAAPNFTDVGRGGSLGSLGITVFVLLNLVLFVLAYLDVI